MPRFSERVKQCMKQVTQVQRALQSMLPCIIISIARETARTQHTPPCIKNKKNTIKVFQYTVTSKCYPGHELHPMERGKIHNPHV